MATYTDIPGIGLLAILGIGPLIAAGPIMGLLASVARIDFMVTDKPFPKPTNQGV